MAFDFLLEAAADLVLNPVVRFVLYPIGWAGLRLLTLGRYPPLRHRPHSREFVAIFGLVSLLLLLLLAAGQFG